MLSYLVKWNVKKSWAMTLLNILASSTAPPAAVNRLRSAARVSRDLTGTCSCLSAGLTFDSGAVM